MNDWKQQLKNLKLSAEAESKHHGHTSKAKSIAAAPKRGDILEQLEALAAREESEPIPNRQGSPAISRALDKRAHADIAVTKVQKLVRSGPIPTKHTNQA